MSIKVFTVAVRGRGRLWRPPCWLPAVAAAQGNRRPWIGRRFVALYKRDRRGGNGRTARNWLSDEPLEEWVRSLPRVRPGGFTAVALPGNDLVGQIPPAIGTLAFSRRTGPGICRVG